MKRKTIYILVVLMSLGMIGIISIQYFWIKNAIDLRRVQFHRAVMAGMNEVTHKLQKIQAYKRFERLKSLDTDLKIDSSGNVRFAYVDESSTVMFVGDTDSSAKLADEKIELILNYGDEYVQSKEDEKELDWENEEEIEKDPVIKVEVNKIANDIEKKVHHLRTTFK